MNKKLSTTLRDYWSSNNRKKNVKEPSPQVKAFK
jgi:hypothetical protein